VALRHRWYLAPATKDASGQRRCVLQTLAGEGAYAYTIYSPDETTALIRVSHDVLKLEFMEGRPAFRNAECIKLRVAEQWGTVPKDATLTARLAAFGVIAATIPDTELVGSVIITLARTRRGLAFDRGEAFPTSYLADRNAED
jgi:hypothetical protein